MYAQMTDEEFRRIYELVRSRYGINMERKRDIIAGRLEKYIRLQGYNTFGEYIDDVERDITGQYERKLVNMLTTNHTFFMREFEHFEYLREVVLPQLKRQEEKYRDLCIWCGAASTGQEPYMLAMLMKDFFGLEHGSWNTQILATDVDTEALQYAIAGNYTKNQIEGLPVAWRKRFLHPTADGEQYEISKELRDEVIFRRFNLMDTFPFKRKMHIVFMRNVMIYFDKETKRQVVRKVYDVMEPGGYLFVGRTETIDRDEVPFELIQPSIFRK